MWIFLATELLLFGSLFTSFATYSALYPSAFREASRYLNLPLGAINTGVLLISSVTVVLALASVAANRRKTAICLLAATIALGLVFLALKLAEYVQHYQDHLAPGFGFAYPGTDPEHAELFFILYFVMTGIHAFHLSIGIAIMTVLLIFVWRGRVSRAHDLPLDLAGLYWHFVDVIWVFLYPVFYLIGRH